jgi:hypothetical protein
VIEAGGDIRPCFFHRPLGNTRDGALHEVLNGPQALQFRRNLDMASDPICQRCVCSLYVPNPETFDASSAFGAAQATHGREERNG